jgi:Domain of Unknown Function (DUF1206)
MSYAHGRRTAAGGASGTTRGALRSAGRVGLTARGIIYVLVGVLAVRIAFGDGGGKKADRQGALQEIASQPLGTALLWVLAAGFACMTLWRGAQALTGLGGSGRSGRSGGSGGSGGEQKVGKRLMNAGRAVFYASVCWGTAAYAAGSGGGSGSDKESKDWTGTVLKWPGGRWIAGAVGCGLVVVGAAIAIRAARRTFLKKLAVGRMSHGTRTAVTASGIGGGVARGTLFAGAGVFVLVAAVRFDPHKARGIDETLRSFARTPAGPWLLVVVAVGLMLFGCFSFASARWRRM